MKFCLIFFNAPFHIAVEKGNPETVQLLLSSEKLNANLLNIFLGVFIKYQIDFLSI